MKQLLQSLSSGVSDLPEVPVPSLNKGHILVLTSCSLVSSGTERMLVEFGRALDDKARQQPDKVQDVLNKARNDGLPATLDAIRSKLDQPLALGYCNVGTVVAVGPGVSDLVLVIGSLLMVSMRSLYLFHSIFVLVFLMV